MFERANSKKNDDICFLFQAISTCDDVTALTSLKFADAGLLATAIDTREGYEGKTLLHNACRLGRKQCAQYLIRYVLPHS